jgi:hypothetical protein
MQRRATNFIFLPGEPGSDVALRAVMTIDGRSVEFPLTAREAAWALATGSRELAQSTAWASLSELERLAREGGA